MALVGNGMSSEVHFHCVAAEYWIFLAKLLLDQLFLGLVKLNNFDWRSLQTYVVGVSSAALVVQLTLIC